MSMFPRHVAAAALALVALAIASPAAASGEPDGTYVPPVDAPVSDPFHVDGGPYGPGNRGIEYATQPGDVVGAAAAGTVVFAGTVAGRRYVTIRHADGVRTAYGPLRDVLVVAGAAVEQGQPIGTAAGAVLFTARVGDTYIDPATLLSGNVTVHLVPEGPVLERRPTWSAPRVPGYTAWPARHLVGSPHRLRPSHGRLRPFRSPGVRAQVSDEPLGRRTPLRPRS
jgi:hypothetical protein